jgi:hypothetical protein
VLSAENGHEANSVLRDIANLAQKLLFCHPVQETVFSSDVDHVTLGCTRILQVAVELIPKEDLSALVPRSVLF